jgi:hypothetical protein
MILFLGDTRTNFKNFVFDHLQTTNIKSVAIGYANQKTKTRFTIIITFAIENIEQ